MLTVQIKGVQKLQRDLKAAGMKNRRALQTAIKVEGFRQLRKLRDDIRAGKPSGLPYDHPLSQIARRTTTGRWQKNQIPLYRLARLLRYNVEYRGGQFHMSFGFVATRGGRLSSSWKQLLIKHQEGIDVLYGYSRKELGIHFANIGARLKKRGDPDARFFFLRRSSGRRLEIPPRPMIEPFWKAHKSEARRNIAKNFRLKLAGKRI